MVSHSVKIKEHKFRWKRIHGSVYECSQATLHLKLRGFGHESTLKEIAQSLTVFFAIESIKKKFYFFLQTSRKILLKRFRKSVIYYLFIKTNQINSGYYVTNFYFLTLH